jgi:D-ribose pyranose/furanose isomerase RbsD
MNAPQKAPPDSRLLISHLGGLIADLGFSEKPVKNSFYRDIPLGWQVVHVGLIRHGPEFDATVDVAIRVAALEEMIDPQETERTRTEQMASFGAELGNIAHDERIRWTVANRDAIPSVARSMLEALVQTGLPYLNRYSDPGSMLDALRPNDRAAWLHSPFHRWRCMRILGLALIAGRANEFDVLRDECRRFLVKVKDPEIQEFEAFADRIDPADSEMRFAPRAK